MPRPKKPGAPEPKRRSRTGCWQCKGRKVKCGEERPACINCQKAGQTCDYSIRLNWDGRRTKRASYDGSSDSTVSPIRSQRSFTIVNQTFKPNGHNRVPTQAQVIKEEHWPADQTTPNWKDDRTNTPTWNPKYETALPFTGARGTAVHPDNADIPPDSQALDAVFPAVHMRSRRSSGSHQFVGLAGQLLQDSASSLGASDAATVFSLPEEGDRGSNSVADSTGVRCSPQHTCNVMTSATSLEASSSLSMRFHQQHNSAMLTGPLTPGTPSSFSDEEPHLPAQTQADLSTLSSPNNHRLSVKSLLSEPLDSAYSSYGRAFTATANTPFPPSLAYPLLKPTNEIRFYGYDLGHADEDIGKNDDQNAISPEPPAPLTPQEQTQEFLQSGGWDPEDALLFGFRLGNKFQRQSAGRGGYYKDPVAIEIPHSLGTLPSKLLENPMNLLYFHHFLNHTARVLMPYDDVESNPFRTILPQMAVKNDHLLSLLLAYSASHRARLLKQKEPEMRMAHWLQDIFPALRSSLSGHCIVSSTNLATAIMLASLEIISPRAFGSNISWQDHLNLARDLMRKRFPAFRQMHSSSHEDQVCSFLWRWFAYLDVLGSLSGGPRQNGSHFLPPMNQGDDPDEIDCTMGFTIRCLHLLSDTADLARSSDAKRIQGNSVDSTWRPSPSMIEKVASLEADIRKSLSRQSVPCTHIPTAPSGRSTLEMAATNEAFHWAALVQLHRRALGKPATHPDVVTPVRMIMECLARIQSGTAEMGMLFPMFTAGCEVVEKEAREEVLERFRNVGRNGMTQIRRARELMENVWKEGRPWETMLKNEFIG